MVAGDDAPRLQRARRRRGPRRGTAPTARTRRRSRSDGRPTKWTPVGRSAAGCDALGDRRWHVRDSSIAQRGTVAATRPVAPWPGRATRRRAGGTAARVRPAMAATRPRPHDRPARTATPPSSPHAIEARWQDRWERAGHVRGAQPRRPARPTRTASATARSCSCSTCSRTRRASGLHVGHPLGYIGTDVFGRYKRMTGHNVLHAMGFDAFGLPAEQYAVQTGTHPRDHDRGEHRQLPPPAAAAGPGPRPAARASPRPTSRTTAGRSGSSCRSSTPGTTREAEPGPPDRRAGRRARGRQPRRRPTAGRGPSCAESSGARSSTTTASPTSPRRR